jgi:LmbE family N-acetylglucosaminyl deacetylase
VDERININKKTVIVIVAHPDDETLWCGGTILINPSCDWFIVSLCRGKDTDRAPKFFKALEVLKAKGIMGDLDDKPDQKPLKSIEIETAILDLLPTRHFNTIITHSPEGEYTRHLRHEETGKAVINLWKSNKIAANNLWTFAYDDGNKKYLPKANKTGTIYNTLSKHNWKKKYKIITEIYGFDAERWEAKTTPKTEAFWQFTKPTDAVKWFRSV